jgi:anthranilate synthase component 1
MTEIFTQTLVADGLTPVRAYANLRASDPRGASFLFESVVGGERWARYSILGYRPTYEALLHREGWEIVGAPDRGEASKGGAPRPLTDSKDPLAAIASLLRDEKGAPPKSVAEKLARSHVGYLAWDIVHVVEKVPPGSDAIWRKHLVPLARLFGGATVVVFDSLAQTVTVASHDADAVKRAVSDMERGGANGPPPLTAIGVPERGRIPSDVALDMDDPAYEANVRRAQEYIAAGDAFQIVLARTFSVPQGERDPFDVYRALRLINPSPYMYYLDLPPARPSRGTEPDPHGSRMQICGASPETMVRLENGVMTVRPLAGTRPRGKTPEDDARLEAELRADPKERSEHVMLIDLGRNDVGRVAEIGSVHLTRIMEIERYSHVMHIVSEVTGKVPAQTPALDVVRAAFPAGTLSGAPKIRAMQIIRELEARPRNVYGGAVGYVADTGDLDFAIAIRTTTCKDGVFEVTAGAGVVEASDPHAEAEETRNKAKGVLAAIEAVPSKS